MRLKLFTLASIILLGGITLCYQVYKNNRRRIESVKLIKQAIEVNEYIARVRLIENQLQTLLISYHNTGDTSLIVPITKTKLNIVNESNWLTKNLKNYSQALAKENSNSFKFLSVLNSIQKEQTQLISIQEARYLQQLNTFNWFHFIIFLLLAVFASLLFFTTRKIGLQLVEKDLANQTLSHESTQKKLRAFELIIAKKELFFQKGEKGKRAAELRIADKERLYQIDEKEKRANELSIANVELSFQNNEKEKRAIELKETLLQLNKSESSLKEAQAISHIGNFEIDLVNKTEVWSDGMYIILMLEKDKMRPSFNQFLHYIHQDDIGAIRQLIRATFRYYESTTFQFRFHQTDGSLRYGLVEVQFELVDGRPIRIFGIFQDVTNAKLAELERNQMLKELIQRNKDLEQFAYIISHNLRAPVANILGASELLKDVGNSTADEVILINGINHSVMKLDEVIKDLNHILDIKTSVNQPKKIVVFRDLISDIKNNIKPLIDKNEITISCNFSEVNELFTLKPYIYSIFYNLITNSIKYRKPHVPVKITILSKKTIKGIELIFADNGLGIDLRKNGEQLFGLYKRFHEHVEGKGMGLFMIKTQVETLNGNIVVSSSKGKGTKFKIALPLL